MSFSGGNFICRNLYVGTVVNFSSWFPTGSLVIEKCPGRPPVTNHQPGPRLEAPTLSVTAAHQRQSTLAQLQMQVQ